MSIGERIREARKKRRLTLKGLGEQVGVTGGAVTGWESGRNIPDAIMLGRLATVLDVPLNWLTETPAKDEYMIAPTVYELAKLIDSLPAHDRQTVISVLHALGYKTTATGAEVVPRAAGDTRDREEKN